MLEDLHALVEFAQAGSIARAADRLSRTPSAITRQVQRLEAALGAELLDRSVEPIQALTEKYPKVRLSRREISSSLQVCPSQEPSQQGIPMLPPGV